MADGPFKVIDGTPAPDTPQEQRRARLRKHPNPRKTVRCHRCSSISMMQIRLGMTWSAAGKPTGGQKQIVCADCYSKGEYVLISF